MLAQLGSPDMRIADRLCARLARADGDARASGSTSRPLRRLDFEAPDLERFPALRIAREALEAGGAAPIVLNAANEVAVAAFLAGAIRLHVTSPRAWRKRSSEADFAAPSSIAEVLEIDQAPGGALKLR